MDRRTLLRRAAALTVAAANSRPLLAATEAPNPATLPPPLNRLVPPRLGSEVELRQLDLRGDGPAWRELQIPPVSASGAVRTERVSIRAGVRAMYALTSGQVFANVKVELSDPAQFDRDRALCAEALRNMHERKASALPAWLKTQPEDVRKKFEAALEPGRPMVELSDKPVHGVDTLLAAENLFAASAVPAQFHFFLPRQAAIVTAYLLNQKETVFTSAADFRRQREAFIDAYARALAEAARQG